MTPDLIFTIIGSIVSLALIAKIIILILLALHLAFSVILLRQTQLMIRVVEANITPVIFAISLFHLLLSLGVFVWALIFL